MSHVETRPGFVNAHTHLYSGLAAYGLPEPSPPPEHFMQLLQRFWWKLDRALDHEMIAAGARLYVSWALLAGTTTLVDHHESPSCIEGSLDVLAGACQELGMRALLCYGATERNGGRDEARAGLAECERFILSNRRPLVRGLVGLHASFTVSDDTVRDAAALCARTGAAMHVHVAEDVADVVDARRRGYDGPLERLLALGALPPGSILAHGVHLSAAQVQEAERRGLWLVQNPRSNYGNRVGYPAALWASEHVALGTDGYSSNMRVELDALERLAFTHREVERADGAGLRARLEAGAELVAAHFGVADAVALGDFFERFGGEYGNIDRVVVGGHPVLEPGRFVTGDLDEIQDRACRAAVRLRERMMLT